MKIKLHSINYGIIQGLLSAFAFILNVSTRRLPSDYKFLNKIPHAMLLTPCLQHARKEGTENNLISRPCSSWLVPASLSTVAAVGQGFLGAEYKLFGLAIKGKSSCINDYVHWWVAWRWSWCVGLLYDRLHCASSGWACAKGGSGWHSWHGWHCSCSSHGGDCAIIPWRLFFAFREVREVQRFIIVWLIVATIQGSSSIHVSEL